MTDLPVNQMKTLFSKSLTEIAIERLRTFEAAALAKCDGGYYLAYSGGKDSDVIFDLAKRSGVKFVAHYHVTTCDPPELIRHIIKQKNIIFDKPAITMWRLIEKRRQPPLRNRRFCCDVLKERGGINALVITGIRWQESVRRKSRRMIETCFKHKQKQFLNPIIDWSTTDVWSYIKEQRLEYCSLYNEGFKRLGCVLCPMSRNIQREIERWPAIAKLWEHAVKKTFNSLTSNFKSAEELWRWWLNRDSHTKIDDKQLMFFSD